ncbi:hypothetical protein AY599_09630 [Leptolyngbya valderiana BDU 20041]|uniref:DUF2283 domain-containing protein n=1 Tax=Baaleninema simplex TaxID=2862350 RepID=UPI00034C39FF|nr:DUF2283 domain-containing protein [Baaleninema simplex]MDC0832045.1 DUF2283 domain-containing protein [Geitlerinema sp. CS-897]OAB63640.1 hypothetical protein AY599_09630 [Leptolyngbya valderiana BDU 20041]
MAEVNTVSTLKVFHDRLGQTLTVWFGNPEDEFEAEETGEEVILMKDRAGRTIGFEKLNFVAEESMPLQILLESLPN